MRILRRFFSSSVLRTDQWDRYKHVRGGLILAMTVCMIGAPIDWYNWSEGNVSAIFPACLSLGILLILFVVPRKWDLITFSFGLMFILSVIGVLVRRAPLVLGLELVLSTGVLYFICFYVGEKRKEPDGK